MNKNILLIAVILSVLMLCSILIYQSSSYETESVNTANETSNTTNTTKEVNKTNNTVNQSAISIPLEKPPFID